MSSILLVEPNYINKYPPLGLMKISTFHKIKKDEVIFAKGKITPLQQKSWDRIYISTLFTFHWNKTVETIEFYLNSVSHPSNIYVGGVLATVLKDELKDKFPTVTIVEGLLNVRGKLGFDDDDIIDSLFPDYSIVNPITNTWLSYEYPTNNSFIAYATRGCVRKCPFCAVPIIEGKFSNSLSILKQISNVREIYGDKRDLLLLDNNILASPDFEQIIQEIKEAGFSKGSTFIYKKNNRTIKVNRKVDFNQGIDARILNKNRIELISQIAIDPLRIAFDSLDYKDFYIKNVRLAAKYNIRNLSNYILFNYLDTPEDFYQRLKINIELNEEFVTKGYKAKIWSFPMRYSPIFGKEAKNRKHKGVNWTNKQLRGIRCILSATHGVVGPKRSFFEAAFGKSEEEFLDIINLPEKYILLRNENKLNGNRDKLKTLFDELEVTEKETVKHIIASNCFNNIEGSLSDSAQKIITIYYQNRSYKNNK